jgi:C4-dicarboxylate-specific signal transduction histidine kinase
MRYHLKPDDPQLQWVDPILRNTQLLQVRLEHLMATVRSGPAVLAMVDLSPLVRESADLFLKGADPRTQSISIEIVFADPSLLVRGDAGRLMQVFLCLFGNAHEAIQSSRTGGRVTIEVSAVREHEEDWVKIDVADDGPGIAEPILERIFEPFFTTKETGSGYGLYLASEIVREQGGRLTVCNRDAGGACFSVWLLRAKLPPSTA